MNKPRDRSTAVVAGYTAGSTTAAYRVTIANEMGRFIPEV